MYRCSRIDNICDLVSYPVLARGPPPPTIHSQSSAESDEESEQELQMELEPKPKQDCKLVLEEDAISLISLCLKSNFSGHSGWRRSCDLLERMQVESEAPAELPPKLCPRAIRTPLGMWWAGDMERLLEHLDENLLGVDAKWLLFRAAVMSDRCLEMLQQCPPYNRPLSRTQIDALRQAISGMPRMTSVQQFVYQDRSLLSAQPEPERHYSLLNWLLLKSQTPQLRQVQHSKLEQLWHQIGQSPGRRPQLVFRVEMPETLCVPELVPPCTFYSGPMDVLHSLIAGPMDANSEYLELHDSLPTATEMSTACACWQLSLCGCPLRTVAVCERCADRVQVRYLLMFAGFESKVVWPRDQPPIGGLAEEEPVDHPQLLARRNNWTELLCQALLETDPMFGLLAVSLRHVCRFIHKRYSGRRHRNSIESRQPDI